MEIFVIIITIGTILLWVDLRDAKSRIERLKRKQEENETRMYNIELSLFDEKTDIETLAQASADANRRVIEKNSNPAVLDTVLDLAEDDSLPPKVLDENLHQEDSNPPRAVGQNQYASLAKSANVENNVATQHTHTPASKKNAQQRAREAIAKQHSEQETVLGETLFDSQSSMASRDSDKEVNHANTNAAQVEKNTSEATNAKHHKIGYASSQYVEQEQFELLTKSAYDNVATQYASTSATKKNAQQRAREIIAKQQAEQGKECGDTLYSGAASIKSINSKKEASHTMTKTAQLEKKPSNLLRNPQLGLSKSEPAEPSFFDKSIAYAKDWLSTGNIPVKIGMLVLFATVIAFLRYATAQGWLKMPMEYRLIGVSLASIGALIFAWTKRETKRSFSLSVQGGSIGILLLVIFSAVKMYGFITPTIGLILSVLAVLLAAILALKQDAKALIIMAIFAGFLAPIWLSDGSGNHVILFTYYAILNVGIFIVSWFKPWRELNLLGFIFTYVIGSTWGGLQYTAENFATTEPFVILFFCFYLLIPLRYAQHASTGEADDGKTTASLLFGTPLVTLVLQVGLLFDNPTWLAWSCVAMGCVYGVLALILRGRTHYEALCQAYFGLSAGFLTLAVPIGLSAKATSAIFALEGAGAVWLGCRERRLLPWMSGTLLQLTSAVGFGIAYSGYFNNVTEPLFLFNEWYLSALLIIVGASVCLWSCYHYAQSEFSEEDSSFSLLVNKPFLQLASNGFFLWAISWWLSATSCEIMRVSAVKMDLFLFITLTATLLIIVYRYFSEAIVACVQSMLIYCGGVVAGLFLLEALNARLFVEFFPLSGWDLTVWGVYAVAGWSVWRSMRSVENSFTDWAAIIWSLSLTAIITVLIYQVLPPEWNGSGLYWWAISAVWLILTVIIITKPQWLDIIAHRPSRDWQGILVNAVVLVVVGLFLWVITLSGGDILWWLPIANAVDSLIIVMAGVILLWSLRFQNQMIKILSYGVVVLFVVSVTSRMTHHWGGFSPWHGRLVNNWNDWFELATFGFWLTVLWLLRDFSEKRPDLSGNWLKWYDAIVPVMRNTIIVMLCAVWFVLLFDGGNISPLPWVPVLNPLAILQWAILIATWRWLQGNGETLKLRYQSMIVPVLGLMLISVMTLRFVHHFGDIVWSPTMLKFPLTQMALTVVWSILGVITWIMGSRRISRPLWLMGALLMGGVLVKLVLFDRSHLGDMFGILSFFAYGVLCVVVGYFSPMPPVDSQMSDDDI